MEVELARRVEKHLQARREELRARGFGGRVRFGEHPALLVVDFVRGFTDTASPLAADFTPQVEATRTLVDAAHDTGVPVVFAIPLAEEGGWARKIPANDLLVEGSPWVELDHRLGARTDDVLLRKHYPSCFFGTDLATRLVARGVDTLVIAGCTTSGCVRSTAVDACSRGFRTIVAADAVGDRETLSHLVALFDIDAKYADVVDAKTAVIELARLSPRAAP